MVVGMARLFAEAHPPYVDRRCNWHLSCGTESDRTAWHCEVVEGRHGGPDARAPRTPFPISQEDRIHMERMRARLGLTYCYTMVVKP
jgi:hypothetical protein